MDNKIRENKLYVGDKVMLKVEFIMLTLHNEDIAFLYISTLLGRL